MTNSSPPRRASAKQARPVLASADAASTHRPLSAPGGNAERRASARQREQAEDLVYDAWEASGEPRAVLAREALALWPDCADAYVLLAQTTASNLEQARELLGTGDYELAFLLRPTPIEQVEAVAAAGETMPPKSTYFYPKLLSGLLFNPLE
jgi:hypothetical protein